MSDVPSDRRYTESHEWVLAMPDGTVRVGITDHAQDAMGEIVYVELPEVNGLAKRGVGVAVVESVKAASDVYAPIDGEIVEVNARLADAPELINSDPYGEGWIMRIKPSDPAAQEGLLDGAAYAKTLES
jgi:glycine cleavage system H protein